MCSNWMPPTTASSSTGRATLDTLEIQVEMDASIEFDAVRLIEQKEREIRRAVESTLGGRRPKITLVSPKRHRGAAKARPSASSDKRKL